MATACWRFPIYSQTFVYQELTQLLLNGFDLRFVYSKLDSRDYLPSQFSSLWHARRRLILHPAVCKQDYAYFEKRVPEKIDRLVKRLADASGMSQGELHRHPHFLQAFAFTRMVEAYQPDYLHSYFFYEGTLFSFVASYLLDIPRGVSCYADHMLKDYALKLVPLHLQECRLVVATSQRIKQELISLVPDVDPQRILVKPNAINAAHFPLICPQEPDDGRPYRLVSVCRIEPKKGLMSLVEAVRILRDRNIQVEWHHLGTVDESSVSQDYARDLETRINDLKLGGVVHFEGRKSESEIKLFFQRSHVFVAPSIDTAYGDKDGIPTSLLEAMASGLAVVGTDAGSLREVIDDGQDGVLVPQRDSLLLANAIEALLLDPKRRRRLGQSAAEKVRKRFDVNVCEKRFHERVGVLARRASASNTFAQPPSSIEGRLHRSLMPSRPSGLQGVSLADLSGEVCARIQESAFTTDEATILLGCQMQASLKSVLDVHNNRMSRKRYRDQFGTFYEWVEPPRPKLEGATIVELGCGPVNPYGFLFMLLMVGARRGIAIDLDTIQDVSKSARAAADCAAMMLIDPKQLVGDYPITREQVLQNIASFDLAKLNAGDFSGIDGDRLRYLQEPLEALSLQDGEADLVISNAVLEHIQSLDDTIAEMARITRKGGFGIHNIDGSDHRRYGDPACHPLEFLAVADDQAMLHGSNRLRPTQFGPMFERHGFEILSFTPYEIVEIDATLRARLVEPFRTMPNEVISILGGKLVVRRV